MEHHINNGGSLFASSEAHSVCHHDSHSAKCANVHSLRAVAISKEERPSAEGLPRFGSRWGKRHVHLDVFDARGVHDTNGDVAGTIGTGDIGHQECVSAWNEMQKLT